MSNKSLHFVVIAFLYLCQGIVQGTLNIVVLILLQRHPSLSAADQATLGLPMYAFSFKFLWAPIIDRYYYDFKGCLSFFHRRAQWVMVLQGLMAVCYLILFRGGDEYLEGVVSSRSMFFYFWVLLSVMAFLNASQDIAVDAWSVEGLPPDEAASAGVLQLVGTVSGLCISNMFVRLNSWDQDLFSLERFCFVSCWTCLFAGFSAFILSLCDTTSFYSSHSGVLASSTGKGVLATLKDVCKSHGLRELVIVLFTRAWPMATWFLVVSRLISMGVITAGTFAEYRVYSMLLQVVLGSTLARRSLRRYHAAFVLQLVSGVDFLASVIFSLLFVTVADPSVKQWYGPLIVFPLIALVVSLSAFAFVANVELCSSHAHRFPRDVGGVLSLLNALSNIGHHFPSTLCLYAAHVVSVSAYALSHVDTSYTAYSKPHNGDGRSGRTLSYQHLLIKSDVIVLSLLFFTLGAVLRYKYLIPAAKFLEFSTTNEVIPITSV